MKNLVHCKKAQYDVYIGRPSKWGNPYVIGKDGTRAEVIAKYREYILGRPDLLAQLPELQGKVLGCWCDPLPCHGEVLLELLRERSTKMKKSEAKVLLNYLEGRLEYVQTQMKYTRQHYVNYLTKALPSDVLPVEKAQHGGNHISLISLGTEKLVLESEIAKLRRGLGLD